jgi:hypothetical protein
MSVLSDRQYTPRGHCVDDPRSHGLASAPHWRLADLRQDLGGRPLLDHFRLFITPSITRPRAGRLSRAPSSPAHRQAQEVAQHEGRAGPPRNGTGRWAQTWDGPWRGWEEGVPARNGCNAPSAWRGSSTTHRTLSGHGRLDRGMPSLCIL